MGGSGVGTRDQIHSRPLTSWLCALWGQQEGVWGGGRLSPGCGAPGVRRSTTSDRLSMGRAAGVRYPLAVGAGAVGVGTRHRPHSARCWELDLRAVGAARGRPGGGAFSLGVGRPGLGALPRPTARPWGVRPGSATHCLWVRGLWAWGPVVNPTARALASWLCVLWGRQEGARGERLVPACRASGVERSSTPDRPSLGRAAGVHYPLAGSAGSAGQGTRHQPHSARSGKLALRAVGAARGRSGRALLAFVWGIWGWALSQARSPVLGACARGLLPTGCGCGGCRRGDPSATPQRGLWRAGFARYWGGTGAPGGGASCMCFGRPGLGALPRPTARPWGVRPGPTTHWLSVRGLREWGPVTNPAARTLVSWLCPLWRRHKGARGGCLLHVRGASGVARSPTPDRPSLGRAAGAHQALAVGAGAAGVKTRHQPHNGRSC